MWHRLRFHVENLLLRGTLYQVTFLVAILAGLAGVAALVVYTFDRPAHAHFWGALWWAFLRLTDTGYLGEDRGLLDRTVSTVLTFSGDIVFLGALVAILTTGFDRALKTLSSGRGRVLTEDHMIILASTSDIAVVAEELLSAHQRVRSSHSKITLVLLLPEVSQAVVSEVMRCIPPALTRSARILCRQGDIFDEESLERVNWSQASHLLVVEPPRCPPAAVFKLLLSLSRCSRAAGRPLPRLVATCWSSAAQSRLRRLSWPSDFDVIPQHDFAGQLLAQTLDSPGLTELYRQLLTDREGDSIHLIRPAPKDYLGKSLREAILHTQDATPIGILKEVAQGHMLVSMAELDIAIEPQDGLVVVASTPHIRVSKAAGAAASGSNWLQRSVVNRVLLCGSCPWWGPLVSDLCQRGGPDFELICLAEEFPPSHLLPPQVVLHHTENLEQALLAYDFSHTPQILVLAGPFPDNPKYADIETIAHIHAILENPGYTRFRPRLLCELFWDRNRLLVQSLDPRIEVVTTARFLQHVVAQVGAKPALFEIYEDLLAVGGCCFRSLAIQDPGPVDWARVTAWSLDQGLVPLGLYLSQPQKDWAQGVHLHPPQIRLLQITGHESLLALQRE